MAEPSYSLTYCLQSGHLQAQAAVAATCWSRCETAAMKATAILTRYRETFELSRAPYLIAYGTYIAATIMVRTAAQQGPSSAASKCLKICIDGLTENAAVNTGARKTLAIIQGLVQRLNVSLPGEDEIAPLPSFGLALPSRSDTSVDIDAIMSSFNFNPSMWNVPQIDPVSSNFQADSLFGISLLGWPAGGEEDQSWAAYQDPS